MSTGVLLSETKETVASRKTKNYEENNNVVKDTISKTTTEGSNTSHIQDIKKKKKESDVKNQVKGSGNDGNIQKSKHVTMFRVLAKMVGELSGKNSIGKLLQYLIKFILQYSSDSQERFNKLMVHKINLSLDDVYGLISKNPILGLRYLKYLFLKNQIDRFSGVADGLSLFRQSLRFGKTPFRLAAVKQQLFDILKLKDYKRLISNNFVVLMIDTSYGIVDEIGLLFKLKYFNSGKHPRFKKVIGDLDALIWFFDILCQLKTGYQQYCELQKIIKELKIENNELASLEKYLAQIEELEFKLRTVKLGLCKAVCDFGFDFIDLFQMHWFFSNYLYYGFGFGSGFFNTWKTYINAEKILNE